MAGQLVDDRATLLWRVLEHEALTDRAWDVGQAEAAVAEIVADGESAVADGGWPAHGLDDEPESSRIIVVEADVRYPSDSGLTLDGARSLVSEAKKLTALVGGGAGRVRDRTRAIGRRLRMISKTMGRRTGERKQEVLRLTQEAGEQLGRSLREARRLAIRARRSARGRGASAKLAAVKRLEEIADRAERVVLQIKRRLAGEPNPNRLVSMVDPEARPIRKGKLGKPNEFGYVAQICEVTQNTQRGARGFIVPASIKLGSPNETQLLPDTVSELDRLGLRPREVAVDGGFENRPTTDALELLAPDRVFIAGRQQPGSRRTQRRLARYRTGAEGRISHLKRGYGMRRSRLKGQDGMKTWTGWAILAYNLDTLAIRTN